MSLDSSELGSASPTNSTLAGPTSTSGPIGKVVPATQPASVKTDTGWVYLFTHSSKVDLLCRRLSEKFETFVHRTVIYTQKKQNGVQSQERQTISGLVFIKGDHEEIAAQLSRSFPGTRLAKDYAAGTTAIIPDEQMQPFIRLSHLNEHPIRFMLHPLAHYRKNHTLIKILSGPLAGMEGFIVRLHRDRKLITTIGSMTVAIGNIHKESIVNAEEYVAARNANIHKREKNYRSNRISDSFFHPENDIDALAIASALRKWLESIDSFCSAANFDKALALCFDLLENIATFFSAEQISRPTTAIGEVTDTVCRQITDMAVNPACPPSLKESIRVNIESILLRYPAFEIAEHFTPDSPCRQFLS